MKRVTVSLGSNIEPREEYLRQAVAKLSAMPETRFVAASRVIETEPVDVPAEFADRRFLNQVAILETGLEVHDFARRMHAIEDELGRVRTVKNGPRTIDVDLLYFGRTVLDEPELTIPHPRMLEREFVMKPLKELLAALPDTTRVDDLRDLIDEADDEIVAALNRRFRLTAEIQRLKRELGMSGRDEFREREIFKRVLAATPKSERDTVYGIYERIFNGSRGVIETIARGVAVRNGRVLLCRARGSSTTYLPGGHIEFGETGAEALVREVKEELGLDSSAGAVLGVLENSFLQHGKPHSEINLVYPLELKGTEDEIESCRAREDWIGFEWCPVEKLESAGLLPAAIGRFIGGSHVG